jgi:hypothetical protein
MTADGVGLPFPFTLHKKVHMVHHEEKPRKGDSMSHDSGFRRGDHNSTHDQRMRRQLHDKSSDQFEERLRRRREESERLRRLIDAKRSDQ